MVRPPHVNRFSETKPWEKTLEENTPESREQNISALFDDVIEYGTIPF